MVTSTAFGLRELLISTIRELEQFAGETKEHPEKINKQALHDFIADLTIRNQAITHRVNVHLKANVNFNIDKMLEKRILDAIELLNRTYCSKAKMEKTAALQNAFLSVLERIKKNIQKLKKKVRIERGAKPEFSKR